MMAITCEIVRDALPDVLAGRQVGPEAKAVLAHVAECAECSAEAALVAALARAPERAPAGLEARIRQTSRRQPARRRFDLGRAALLAAGVGSVLLGSSLYLRSRGEGPPVQVDGRAAVAVGPTDAAGGQAPAPVAAAPSHRAAVAPDGRALIQALPGTPEAAGLYSSTPTLEDLSEEELNTLLKELQS